MIIYQFIYIWPTSFTEYATVQVTWRVTPSGLKLKISDSNTQGMTPPPLPPPPLLKLGEAEEFESVNFLFYFFVGRGARLFSNFRGDYPLEGDCISCWETWYFLAPKLKKI